MLQIDYLKLEERSIQEGWQFEKLQDVYMYNFCHTTPLQVKQVTPVLMQKLITDTVDAWYIGLHNVSSSLYSSDQAVDITNQNRQDFIPIDNAQFGQFYATINNVSIFMNFPAWAPINLRDIYTRYLLPMLSEFNISITNRQDLLYNNTYKICGGFMRPYQNRKQIAFSINLNGMAPENLTEICQGKHANYEAGALPLTTDEFCQRWSQYMMNVGSEYKELLF